MCAKIGVEFSLSKQTCPENWTFSQYQYQYQFIIVCSMFLADVVCS